jgi:hypothetical protein
MFPRRILNIEPLLHGTILCQIFIVLCIKRVISRYDSYFNHFLFIYSKYNDINNNNNNNSHFHTNYLAQIKYLYELVLWILDNG